MNKEDKKEYIEMLCELMVKNEISLIEYIIGVLDNLEETYPNRSVKNSSIDSICKALKEAKNGR